MNRSINFKTFDIKRINLPFCNGNFQYLDVKQGSAGTCWFLSALASYLRPDHKLLERQMNLQNRIRKIGPNLYIVLLKGMWFVVDDYMLSYYNTSNYSYLWPILFEKAMLSYMSNSWKKYQNYFLCDNILIYNGEYNKGSLGFELILSSKGDSKLLHPMYNLPMIDKKEILKLWKSGYFMCANTNRKTFSDNPKSVKKLNLIKNHCYAILNITDNNITLYNPYGYCNTTNQISRTWGQFNYTWDEFMESFNCVHYSY